MQSFRVALAQISPRLGDLDANVGQHLEIVRAAARDGAGVVVFPELSLTGYLLRDQVPEVALCVTDRRFRRLVRASRSIDVVVGFVEETADHRYHNAAAYLSGGRVVHVHRKLYLPSYGMFHEGRDFAPGETLRSFQTRFGTMGMLVCEDAWHPTSAFLLAQQGAQTIFVLSNGPTRGARPGHGISSLGLWQQLIEVTARFQTVFAVYVNRTGVEDGITFGGGSVVVDPLGRTLTRLAALEEEQVQVELDGEVLRRARTAYPLLRDANIELVLRETDRIRRLRFELPDEIDPDGALEPTRKRPTRRTRRR